MAYTNTGSSGIVAKAALAGVPLIVVDNDALLAYVTKRGLGFGAASTRPEDIAAAIQRSKSFDVGPKTDLFASPDEYCASLISAGYAPLPTVAALD
jgi:hypothetical protein